MKRNRQETPADVAARYRAIAAQCEAIGRLDKAARWERLARRVEAKPDPVHDGE